MASSRFTLPMTAGGGAFLACAGAGLMIMAFAPAELWPVVGTTTAVVAMIAMVGAVILCMKRRLGRPSRSQIIILYATIAAEFLVIWQLAPHLGSERTIWMWVLAIVGLHFLPMYWTHGVRIVWLGLACMAVALVGLLTPGAPLFAVIAVDGALKLIFGLWMLTALNGPAIPAGAAK